MSGFIHSPEPSRVSLHGEPGEASLVKPPPLQKLPGSYSHSLGEHPVTAHSTHTHTHTHIHTHRHTHTQIHTDTHTNTHTQTHIDTHTQTDTHTDTDTHILRNTQTHTHTDTHTHTHSAAGRAPRAPTCSAYNRCSIPADLLRIPCRADAT